MIRESLMCLAFVIPGATVAAQDKLQPPKDPPQFYAVTELSKDHITLKELGTTNENAVYKLVLKDVRAYEASGKKLLGADLVKRVRTGAVVLVTDNDKVEPEFLSVLKEDALVFVRSVLRAKVTTASGEDYGSKVTNIFHGLIPPNERDIGGFNYNAKTMWHSAMVRTATIDVAFSRGMEMTKLAIHSQHSGGFHAAKAVRISVLEDGKFRVVTHADLDSVDETVAVPKTKARVWRFEFQPGDSGYVLLRGLRFFSGEEPFPPFTVIAGESPATKKE